MVFYSLKNKSNSHKSVPTKMTDKCAIKNICIGLSWAFTNWTCLQVIVSTSIGYSARVWNKYFWDPGLIQSCTVIKYKYREFGWKSKHHNFLWFLRFVFWKNPRFLKIYHLFHFHQIFSGICFFSITNGYENRKNHLFWKWKLWVPYFF